jgi:hypothetical protein
LARSCGVSARRAHNLPISSRPARSIDRPRNLVTPETRCATTKAMIVSSQKPDQLATFDSISASTAPERAWQPASVGGAGLASARESSGRGKNAGTGSGQDGFRIGTIAGTHLALTSSRPGHTRVSSHSPERKRR